MGDERKLQAESNGCPSENSVEATEDIKTTAPSANGCPSENSVETTDDIKTTAPSAEVDNHKITHDDPKCPNPFNYDSVMLIDEWEKWSNSFKSYLQRTGIDVLCDDLKIATLVGELGPKGKELLKNFKTIPPTSVSQSNEAQADPPSDPNLDCEAKRNTYDLTKYEDVISAFTTYFVSKSSRNLVYERFKFNTFNWLFGQPLSDYIKVLRRAAARCDFLETDCMIRDRLLLQVKDITLLERLLKIKDLTLEKTIEMFQEHEDKDYRHNPAAQRPPPESESAAKRRRKRKRKALVASESAGAEVQSKVEPLNDSSSEANYNKGQDTTKLKPSKKKRRRWAKALQNVKQDLQI